MLQKPLKFGWKRSVDIKDRIKSVIYTSTCGRQYSITQADELNKELWEYKCQHLRMENFSFDHEIEVPRIQANIASYIGNLANEWLIKMRHNKRSLKILYLSFIFFGEIV